MEFRELKKTLRVKKQNILKNMPKELSLFLKNRPDLIALKFHEKKYETKRIYKIIFIINTNISHFFLFILSVFRIT